MSSSSKIFIPRALRNKSKNESTSTSNRIVSGSGSGIFIPKVLRHRSNDTHSELISRMGTLRSNQQCSNDKYRTHIIFYGQDCVLLGFHNYGNTRNKFGALGGMSENHDGDNRIILFTGIRELLEELFMWKSIDSNIIINVMNLCPETYLCNSYLYSRKKGYIIYYPLEILQMILTYIAQLNIPSRAYNSLPETCNELINNRDTFIKDMEISTLLIFPRALDNLRQNHDISEFVLNDVVNLNNYFLETLSF